MFLVFRLVVLYIHVYAEQKDTRDCLKMLTNMQSTTGMIFKFCCPILSSQNPEEDTRPLEQLWPSRDSLGSMSPNVI